MNRVIVTNPMIGLVGMQVCAARDATDEEILKVCNTENPSGTSGGWSKVFRKVEEGYENMENSLPVQCEDYKNRIHFIIIC